AARRDFVANVSHELRTPITSVKGFVETLRDGAIEDTDDAKRFLEIIARQADRLENIVEDLLSLARIEREDSREEMPLTESLVIDILRSAKQSCIKQASQKEISIEVLGDEHMTALVNAPLLEQAVTNLVDNAVKYSEPGTNVIVEVSVRLAIMYIDVRDQGCGIESRHLPRIFERFYRVDKARSRQIGGTGLGLAIVKHIAKAHGGHVSVESTPGKGSTFTIYFPHRLPDEVALELG
ncbi:PAS domain-containing sensor histidine kinase, partial [bacterium]|nr:PAS domain-containing sensor histidine kinase [bacterium]